MKAILFDMDGTVFDTEQLSYECWVQAAKNLELPIDIDALIIDMYGLNNHTFANFFSSRFGEDFPYRELIAERERCLAETIAINGLPPKPGVPEVFDVLRTKGTKLGLVSSTELQTICKYLKMSGLENTFDVIVSGDMVKCGKPDPESYLLACRKLGLSPADCTVVEDSKNGLLAGSRAGMRTVHIPDRQPTDAEMIAHRTHCLSSLRELPDLLNSLEQNQ